MYNQQIMHNVPLVVTKMNIGLMKMVNINVDLHKIVFITNNCKNIYIQIVNNVPMKEQLVYHKIYQHL